MNLTKTNWPLGWQPGFDPVNGNPDGLLRMDNLQLDELGHIGLVKGLRQVVGGFPDYVDQIYSKQIGANEAIWVALNNQTTKVARSLNGTFSDEYDLLSSSSGARCVFGDALGRVLVIAGNNRFKDSALANPQKLGLLTPAAPSILSVSQAIENYAGVFTVDHGTDNSHSSTGEYFLIDPTLDGICTLTLFASKNTLRINGNDPSDDPSTDIFRFEVIPDDSQRVTKLQVQIIMDADNYYSYTWSQGEAGGQPSGILKAGAQQTTTLSITRGDFTRFGTDSAKDWTTVTAIKFSVEMDLQQNITFQNPAFTGGSQGPLNGTYVYAQVNKNNTGQYLAGSPLGASTAPVTVINGKITITPSSTEVQVTDCWIFRKNVLDTAVAGTVSPLDQFYLVGQTTPGVNFVDLTTDQDAINQGIIANEFLLTLQTGDANSVSDTILGMEGLYNERMLYITGGYLYLSDRLNPDAVDSRYTIKASGDPTETNLWIQKLSNNVLILGTTKNLYEITGTLLDLPDGSIDASIIGMGEALPPISYHHCAVSGNIFYRAADGIRYTAGSNSKYFTDTLQLLFQGQTRSGFPSITNSPFADYQMAAGKNRLYFIMPTSDGSRWLFVYSFPKDNLFGGYWRVQYTDPVSIFTTLSDRVLLGYNVGSVYGAFANGIFQLDTGNAVTNSSGVPIVGAGFSFNLTTVFDSNGQPRNRKDTFTLKLVLDVNANVTVAINRDTNDPTSGWTVLSTTTVTTGMSTVYFDLSSVTLGFRYAIRITDTNQVSRFHLYEATIEYDPRPEQLNYLRIPNNNLGTISRKRFNNYAFVVDTLGNNVNFIPYIDNSNSGISPANTVVNTNGKVTVRHDFTQEQVGVDIGGVLSGGVFEFYGVHPEEIVSEKLPPPSKYLIIPANDYGSPNRKRHTSYKFQINTRGQNVLFTPVVDGVSYTATTVNTTTKRTFEHFFTINEGDIIGIDIGGILDGQGNPFEFYGVITPQKVELLPDRLKYLRVPNSNYGVAARKRIRTIPLVIDTFGQAVTFTPILDGVTSIYTSTFTTTGKTTVYHYFPADVFPTDIGAILSCASGPFEFYEFAQPEVVETLPVGKRFDQLGPLRFDKIGKIFGFRVRLIATGGDSSDINLIYSIAGDSNPTVPSNLSVLYSGTISVSPLLDQVYEVNLPKSINTTICRIILGPCTDAFHRFDAQIKVSMSGMESDSRWVPVR